MPTDTTCRCGCGQERQRQADGRLGAWAGPDCVAQARTRTPRHPDPLAPLRGESRTEEIIASQLRSTASELQGMDLAMQQRLDEQARAQKDREGRVVVTTCPDCGGRAYLEPECTRILPDGSRETYVPIRCDKRCKRADPLCPECRTRFEPNGAQRFCSDPCRVANWNRKKPTTKEDAPMSQPAPAPALPKPDLLDEPEFPARLNPPAENLCACGCGRPVGPRGTRFATQGCASRRPRGKMSPEARANMSAAAKARAQREGRVGNRAIKTSTPRADAKRTPPASATTSFFAEIAALAEVMAAYPPDVQQRAIELGEVEPPVIELLERMAPHSGLVRAAALELAKWAKTAS